MGTWLKIPFFVTQRGKSTLGCWLLRLLDHTQTNTARRTLLNEWLAHSQRLVPAQQTKRNALSGIRNCDPSNPAAENLRLRPRGHRDLLHKCFFNVIRPLAFCKQRDRYICCCQYHHMSLMDFVVSSAGYDRSVTDFWGWDVHEKQLLCPDEVDGDIWLWSTRRGLKPKFYWTTQTMVTMGIIPFKEKSPGIEPGTSWSVVRNSDH
jgi:hypothetical protein